MYIDENTLKFYLDDNSNYEKLENSKKAISERFNGVKEVFNTAKGINIKYDELKPHIEKYKSDNPNKQNQGYNCDTRDYGLGRVFVVDKKLIGMQNQNTAFDGNLHFVKNNFVLKLLFVMSGYDFETKQVVNEYRILSNTSVNPDFSGSTYSQGQCAWINSHFSDNTLFIEFVDFIKNCCKTGGDNKEKTYIALCYPGRVTNEKEAANDYEKQKEILEFRFPYKFMWMWANADNVIHPISLDAFRNFLKSDFMQEIFKELPKDENFKKLECGLKYKDNKKDINKEEFSNFELEKYAEIITDCHFDSFPKIWQSVSDKIYEKTFNTKLNSNEERTKEEKEKLQKLSKVISLLCIGETDMKNISDLLKTHKQIILYGVPGTGKTHSAKDIIKEWQAKSQEENSVEKAKDDEKNELDDCKFSKLLVNKNKKDEEEYKNIYENKKIIWDIVQFHPNYSYQDFIGGIAPNVDDNGSLSYTLNDGIFKKFCDCAKANGNIDFIFIIDEINRANLSEVFGELLYALEYRDESVSVANFDEFCIPSNVYIIGTMNNVDKSLATFDLALRRRFGFYEVGVDYDVIAGIIPDITKENNSQEINNNQDIQTNINGYIKRCKELNYILTNDERLKQEINIEGLKGIKLENTQDHYKIGHAYFMKIKNFMDKDEFVINPQHLEKLWIYHIEPLLMEYLGLSYDDSNVKKSINEIKKHFVKKLDEE